MAENRPSPPRIFVDADVLFAGSASSSVHGASLVILRMAELTLLDAITSEQAIEEVERNLRVKAPGALPAFQLLVSRALDIVPDPNPDDLRANSDLADPKDLPILVAALRERCSWLITLNLRHYQPGHADVSAARPGDFVQIIRQLLASLEPRQP